MTSSTQEQRKPTGRPQVHFVTEKPCVGCGRAFTMKDRDIKHPSWFRYVRYCSDECRLTNGRQPNPTRNDEQLRRLLAEKSIAAEGGCINWTGATYPNGYGSISHGNRKIRAHRLAYELANGPIPKGMMILHGCDNRRCINPEHLRAGTAKENMADCVSRGRAAWQQLSQGAGPGQPVP